MVIISEWWDMEATSSPEIILSDLSRSSLLQVARSSILQGLERGVPLKVNAWRYSKELRRRLACFVSLHIEGKLRGCMGGLRATTPLVIDTANRSFAAAFQDPRFPPLNSYEYQAITLHVSILGPLQRVSASSEEELLAGIEPGADGLLIEDHNRSATFLPIIWQQIPEPSLFLQHLKAKAGWTADYWSRSIKAYRYRTIDIEEGGSQY